MATHIPPPQENQEENKGTEGTEQVQEKLVATENEKSIATTPNSDNTNDEKAIGDKPAKKRTRCAHPECKKKVTLIGFDCRCGLRFCSQHVAAEEHECTFDYKEAGKKVLQENNQLIAPTKVTKI